MSLPSEESLSNANVVAAVLVSDPAVLPETFEAIGRQVYGPSKVYVVGGGDDAKARAEASGMLWAANIARLLAVVNSAVTHLWFIHDGVVPRPDALRALVTVAAQTEAAVAGSKVLRKDRPSELLSVGTATDVYEVPYGGLDEAEVDQGQYDVVRDVAVVSGSSMLIRRDLAAGIGGTDPRLPPQASAVDLCQRARLRGARVIIVPSSEVLAPADRAVAPKWREDAGRVRTMIKCYGLLTLLWALPLEFVIGFAEAIVAPFLGRWTLFAWLRTWVWVIVQLPSSLIARRHTRRGRVVGDAELFRYQLKGSARVRSLVEEAGDRLRTRLPEESRFRITELIGEFRRPAFVTGFAILAVVAFATRSIWRFGLPPSGYALRLPERGADLLAAYSGGWNPAGLGSAEPLPPMLGALGVLQAVLLNRPGLTMTITLIVSVIAAIWGTARLVRGWGLDAVSGLIGGVVLVSGPAAATLAEQTHLGAVIALGALPWATRAAVKQWPAGWWPRLSRVAAIAALVAVTAVFEPLLLPVPVAGALLWVVFGDWRAWPGAVAGLLATAIASVVLFPWLGVVDLERYLTRGEAAFWDPAAAVTVAIVVAVVFAVAGSDRAVGSAAAWGGVVAGAGAFVARTADFGAGRFVAGAGLAIASLGIAVVAASALASFSSGGGSGRRWLQVTALAAGVVLVAMTVPNLSRGRLGFPRNEVDELMTVTRAEEPLGSSRVLMFGDPDELPGESRDIDGAGFRLVSIPEPTLAETLLNEPLSGDTELEAVLRTLVAGETTRLGEDLAPFGVGWIVVVDDSPFADLLAGQLDLVRLGTRITTFRIEAPNAVRARPDPGVEPWVWDGSAYRGQASDRLLLAENADAGWGSRQWEQVGWANEVDGSSGVVTYRGDSSARRQAMGALGLFAFLGVVALLGREKR